MVVDCPSQKPLPIRRDWYPDATWINGLPTHADFARWLDGLDVVYTAETGYGSALWDEAERLGVKTVLHANWEFLDRRDRPTLWAAPSNWNYLEFPMPRQILPVPIELDRFPIRRYSTEQTATRFLHIVGRPAVHDRNGTNDLLHALTRVNSEISVTIKCQEPGYVENMIRNHVIPSNVSLTVDSGDAPNYWDAYTDQDVLIMPRKFGGLCLPVNEALGAGMPVIMTKIEPNKDWLPEDWLAPAEESGAFQVCGKTIYMYTVSHQALANRIDAFAQSCRFYADARFEVYKLSGELGWESLKPLYEKTFEGVMGES